jgi:hypothetical protein
MATPLGVTQVVKVAVQAKLPPKSQRNGDVTSFVDRNRVEPKTKVTGQKVPLEVANRKPKDVKPERPVKINYKSTRDVIPLTYKGYPRSKFKGKVQPNVPL